MHGWQKTIGYQVWGLVSYYLFKAKMCWTGTGNNILAMSRDRTKVSHDSVHFSVICDLTFSI